MWMCVAVCQPSACHPLRPRAPPLPHAAPTDSPLPLHPTHHPPPLTGHRLLLPLTTNQPPLPAFKGARRPSARRARSRWRRRGGWRRCRRSESSRRPASTRGRCARSERFWVWGFGARGLELRVRGLGCYLNTGAWLFWGSMGGSELVLRRAAAGILAAVAPSGWSPRNPQTPRGEGIDYPSPPSPQTASTNPQTRETPQPQNPQMFKDPKPPNPHPRPQGQGHRLQRRGRV
jgi:hypothetical protein